MRTAITIASGFSMAVAGGSMIMEERYDPPLPDHRFTAGRHPLVVKGSHGQSLGSAKDHP